jgi:superfamily I DNA/RNA helicase
LFSSSFTRHSIVGGGVFARADILPTSLAWEAFGTTNGAASHLEMRKRIAHYRGQADDPRQDYMIGCRILTQPFGVTTTLCTGSSFHCPLIRDSAQHARLSNGIRRVGF